MALLGLEPGPAVLAVIEELAGVGRHRLDGLVPTGRAGQDGLELHPVGLTTPAKSGHSRFRTRPPRPETGQVPMGD
jgi:hypothetical protein